VTAGDDAGGSGGRPAQPVLGLWNISFGFFGIQIGFALQNANVSRIFQSLGTAVEDLAILWVAAPLTGLIVQPLVGHCSDRTWGPLGRRRPFFLAGAVLAAAALVAMPNAGGLVAAALLLWLLDAALNVTMEPFRAFVGDMLPPRQRPAGYAFQTGFIGAGAVAASLAPLLLNDLLGVPNTAADGGVPPSVRLAFYLGAAALLLAVLWTVVTTREYPPPAADAGCAPATDIPVPRHGARWLAGGLALLLIVRVAGGHPQLLLLGGLAAGFGLLKLFAAARIARGRGQGALPQIVGALAAMPPAMQRLAVVQCFTWSALFILWIFATPVVALRFFGAADPAARAFNEGADWVGVLFATYNGAATVAAFTLPALVRAVGLRRAHCIGLVAGAIGFAGFVFLRDPVLLLAAMLPIGLAWASVLTLPYALLCGALPPHRLGVYMGLFNIFIVLPQLVVSSVMGPVVAAFFPADPTPVMAVAAALLLAAALAMRRVPEPEQPVPDRAAAGRAAQAGVPG
jgi:maltose/moltooligosaccharide transporter